jgi:hypothetical protein
MTFITNDVIPMSEYYGNEEHKLNQPVDPHNPFFEI